jgi:hypothetical protein
MKMQFVEKLVEAGVPEEEAEQAAQNIAGSMLLMLKQFGGDNLLTLPVEVPKDERGGFDILLSWWDGKSESELRIEAQERTAYAQRERDEAIEARDIARAKSKTAGKLIARLKPLADNRCACDVVDGVMQSECQEHERTRGEKDLILKYIEDLPFLPSGDELLSGPEILAREIRAHLEES